jgi:hypothetical protein
VKVFSFVETLPSNAVKKKVFAGDRRVFSACGKVVQSVCNTSKTFAHFSLALDMSIGDNPARSKSGST